MATQHGRVWELFVNLASHRNIGQQHELLHQSVGLLELLHLDIDGVLGIVLQTESDLGTGQGQGPHIETSLLELLGQHVQGTDSLSDIVLHAVIIDPVLGLLVGQRSLGGNHTLGEPHVHNLGIVVQLPDAREGETLHIGSERAQVGAQKAGQHINSLVDQIHCCSAAGCLLIHDVVGLDEMCHIGNVYITNKLVLVHHMRQKKKSKKKRKKSTYGHRLGSCRWEE